MFSIFKGKTIFLLYIIKFAVIYSIDRLVGTSIKNLISDRINRKSTKTKMLIILIVPNKTLQKGFFIIYLLLFHALTNRKL